MPPKKRSLPPADAEKPGRSSKQGRQDDVSELNTEPWNSEENVQSQSLLAEDDDSEVSPILTQTPKEEPNKRRGRPQRLNDTTEESLSSAERSVRQMRSRNKSPAASLPINTSKRGRTEITDDSSDTEEEDEESFSYAQKRKKSKKGVDEDDEEETDKSLTGSRRLKPGKSLKQRIRSEENERSFTNSNSGIVKSLRMYNFMCHDSFFQEWHNNLNFITGENGSGKSALLSGMLIGLGAKATVTSRTKSISSLIKKGKDHARTEIVLLNCGNLPEDKYGDELTIERTICKNGSSQYRICADHGKWRQLKRNELNYILLSFNIQLDNPVAILNQEVAKNFLRTKDPKSKYTLFYEGTLLAKLYSLLSESKVDIDASERNLEFHKNIISEMKKVVVRLEGKMKEFNNLNNIKDHLTKLNLEYMWALVSDEEKTQDDLKVKLQTHEKEMAACATKLEGLESKKKELEEKASSSADSQQREISEKLAFKERELGRIRQEHQRSLTTVQKAKVTIKTNKPLIQSRQRNLKDVEEIIEQLKSVSVEDEERVTRIYEEKKAELEGRKASVMQTVKTLRQDGDQFKHGADQAREQLAILEDQNSQAVRLMDAKKKNLERLMSPADNKYACYGQSMEVLMAKIKANLKRFSQPPRGPLGSHLTVKEPKYSALIEGVMTKFLRGFLVNSPEDMILLKQLIDQSWGNDTNSRNSRFSMGGGGSGPRPQIFQCKFANTRYDISKGLARISSHPTLLDLFEVENNDHVVVNALCDYVEAEKIIMFESNQAAATVMKDPAKCPKTCKFGYTLEHYRFYPVPHYSAKVLPKGRGPANLLKTSKKAQVEQLKGEIEEMQAQIDEMQPTLESSRSHAAKLRSEYLQRNQELEKVKKQLSLIERELRENETKKFQPPDIASHEEEKQRLEAEIETYHGSNDNAQTVITTMKPKIEELEAEKAAIEEEIPTLLHEKNSFVEIKEKTQKQVEQMTHIIRRLVFKISEAEKMSAPILKQLEQCEKELERKKEQAEEAGARVTANRSSESVKKEFTKVKEKISAMEKHLGSVNSTKLDLERRKRDLEVKVKEYRPTYKSFCILRELIESQLAFLFKKRAEISNSIGITYSSLASQRGYKGQLLIDHEKQELHFFICPDKSSSARTDDALQVGGDRHATKTLIEYSLGLSGGERSFSTICFIMSLWQVMECPFYMLDEFDVFMDAFNRKASQQALIQHAKTFNRNQFFLFSPLDLFEVPPKKDATTLRLKPARPEAAAAPESPVADSEAENVDPTSSLGTPSTSKGGGNSSRGRKPAMAEKNRVIAARR